MERRTQPRHAPTEVLADLMAAYNRGAPHEAAALYAEEGRHEDVAMGRPNLGREAIGCGLTGFLTSFPDAHWSVELVVGDQERAAAAYELTGTLQADLGPFSATGQRLRLAGLMLVSVVDGIILSSRDYWDSGTLGQQLRAAADGSGGRAGAAR
jgi:steroid delta-isomerase-like uncharacterized protein